MKPLSFAYAESTEVVLAGCRSAWNPGPARPRILELIAVDQGGGGGKLEVGCRGLDSSLFAAGSVLREPGSGLSGTKSGRWRRLLECPVGVALSIHHPDCRHCLDSNTP